MKRAKHLLAALCLIAAFSTTAQDLHIDTLIKELGFRESRIPSRDMEGWSRPKKITIQSWSFAESGEGSKAWLQEVADGVTLEFVRGTEEIKESIVDSDAFIGWCNEVILDGKELNYIQINSAGIDRCNAIPELRSSKLIATNGAKTSSETIAEHSMSLLMALTRNLSSFMQLQAKSEWNRGGTEDMPESVSLKGKALLVLGLGGIGSQVAKRGYAMGMRVIGTRNSSRNGPSYVDYVGLSDETLELAKQADVVINCLPLTDNTRQLVGKEFFSNMKDGGYYVSVGRGKTTDTEALVDALESGKLNGAGLDVTDPEPLPEDHALWGMTNVIITPHVAGRSDLTGRIRLMLMRENLRRYIQGEKLLNMVDLERGY